MIFLKVTVVKNVMMTKVMANLKTKINISIFQPRRSLPKH